MLNQQGDVIALLDGNGNVVVEYDYDAETGFYYLNSRYYAPVIGRFLNTDSLIAIDDFLGYNLFTYCNNNPVVMVDYTGEDGQTIELGRGWYYRIDLPNQSTGTKRHIHIWKNGKSYAQNDDGSPHDQGKNDGGKLPKWPQEEVKNKTGWDYNGKRKEFFGQTKCVSTNSGRTYSYANGKTVYQEYNPYVIVVDTIDSYEGVYMHGRNAYSDLYSKLYVIPMLNSNIFPSFSLQSSWGFVPFPIAL